MKNSEKVKIFFIGRKQGIVPFYHLYEKMENSRLNEKEAFFSHESVVQTHSLRNADIIFNRNKPERTSEFHIQRIYQKLRKYNHKLIINNINAFYNYDSKDRAFTLWQQNSLLCPAFEVLDLKEPLKQIIDKTFRFLDEYGKILLRTNNETGSNGMKVIDNQTGTAKIELTVREMADRISWKQKKRKDIRLMLVEFIDSRNSEGFLMHSRVHILGKKILSYYTLSSRKNHFHAKHMTMEDMDTFIKRNEQLHRLMQTPGWSDQLIHAIELLGCNLGGLDFIIADDKPILLELNPMWGKHRFGDHAFMKYLVQNRKTLNNRIPVIYEWLDPIKYYQKFYTSMASMVK